MKNNERLEQLLGVEINKDDLRGCEFLKCPDEFKGKACPGCPYANFWENEYTGWEGE